MAHSARNSAKTELVARHAAGDPSDTGQTVLVLQGGGALGAYQVGVYEALHEAGVDPDWVIGTSIGAINGAIIAGNPAEKRLAKLTQFWDLMQVRHGNGIGAWLAAMMPAMAKDFANHGIYAGGINGFFAPNPQAAWGVNTPLGAELAAFYSTAPLQNTLLELTDFDYINANHGRLTLGAVNVKSGEMHYFDSRDQALGVKHVMASGALPPAFPAVRIDGETYWDGGIYSNTPIEVVLDDKPRRNSLIFSANVWHPTGPEPDTISQVLGRQKDIQYASRVRSHVQRQQQIHRMRHIIRDLAQYVPEARRGDPEVKELMSYGCATVMHVVPLFAPRVDGEDHTKDIDFSPAGIKARRSAGYADTRRALDAAPWQREVDAMDGVIIHRVQA
jgi:NTE family protein